MTIKQLIEELSKIEDQDIRVMVRGYEGGVNDMVIGHVENNNPPVIHYIALDVNEEWYYGAHEPIDNIYEATNSEYQIVKAIIL